MSKEVVVFTKRPEDGVCPGCKMLKRKLDSEGIPYKEIPYDPENEEHVRIVKGAKFSALPVTFPNGAHGLSCAVEGFAVVVVAADQCADCTGFRI